MRKQVGEPYSEARYQSPGRSTISELRQRYLERQLAGEKYSGRAAPQSFDTKSDYFYVPTNSDRKSYLNGKFALENSSLPYYVVPVLYVPQKVLSTEEIRPTSRQVLDKRELETFFGVPKNLQTPIKQHLPSGYNYEGVGGIEATTSETECDSQSGAVANPTDVENGGYYNANYSTSLSTINDDRSFLRQIEDSSDHHSDTTKFDYNYKTRYDDNKPGISIGRGRDESSFCSTLYGDALTPKFKQFSDPSVDNYPHYQNLRLNSEPKSAPAAPERSSTMKYFTGDKNVRNSFNWSTFKKPKKRLDYAYDSDVSCDHSAQYDDELDRRRKICMQCLRNKHLTREEYAQYYQRQLDEIRGPSAPADDPMKHFNDIKLVLNKSEDTKNVSRNSSNSQTEPQKEVSTKSKTSRTPEDLKAGDRTDDSRSEKILLRSITSQGETKSTQTITSEKITSGTQTEMKLMDDVDLPVGKNFSNIERVCDCRYPLKEEKDLKQSSETHPKSGAYGRNSQIPQPTVQPNHDMRAVHADPNQAKIGSSKCGEQKCKKKKKCCHFKR